MGYEKMLCDCDGNLKVVNSRQVQGLEESGEPDTFNVVAQWQVVEYECDECGKEISDSFQIA